MDMGITANFRPDAKISSYSAQQRLFRARAIEEAHVLFARAGAEAIRTVQWELRTPDLDADERRYRRLILVELERLDRGQRRHVVSGLSLPRSLIMRRPRQIAAGHGSSLNAAR